MKIDRLGLQFFWKHVLKIEWQWLNIVKPCPLPKQINLDIFDSICHDDGMEKQNQIKRTLTLQGSIDTVRRLLDSNLHSTRASLARAVCAHFCFLNPHSVAQFGGCIKALRELERAGHFQLPATRYPAITVPKTPKRLGRPLEVPCDVPAKVGDVRGLALIKVETSDHMRMWNEMMFSEHPQGAGPLVGAQMRYLISSEHGWLGGFGFAASALHLGDRDRWIGWNDETRKAHLHRVVGMARFLIRPMVKCWNLASHVLGMVLRGLAQDFDTRYGYRPWLVESFVETDYFAGTCYKAANWVEIGQTKGRGRQDRENKKEKTVKAIYVYPLESDFRDLIVVVEPASARIVALDPTDGIDGDIWAEHEFGGANLGDARLNARLVDSARTLFTQPGRMFCATAQGDWPATKGFYRMIDRPDEAAVNVQSILAPHRRRTVQRMKAQKTVLCIQDGTSINYSRLVQTTGLGVIGTNQTGATSSGLHMHSTFIVSTDGLPLGVLDVQITAPPPPKTREEKLAVAEALCKGKQETKVATPPVPIEEKKTFSWIVGLRECIELAPRLPDTRQVCVMDREADIFEVFDEQRQSDAVDLLVRARHDRSINEEYKLFESVRQAPVLSRMRINVPRQSARVKKSKQAVCEKKLQRSAEVELRSKKFDMPVPVRYRGMGKKPVTLWVVHVVEPSPPAGAEPLEWFLLTNREITTIDLAQECLRWYCLRWRIEDWHRVLKTGCKIEDLQHKTADRLKRVIAINLVLAWRIMLMTLLGRTCPALPADILFSDIECEVLAAYAKKKDSLNQPTSEMLFDL